MKKRKLFAELEEGFEALANERAGKITLSKVTVEYRPVLGMTVPKWSVCAQS